MVRVRRRTVSRPAHDAPPARGLAHDAGVATVAATRTASQAPVASASRNAHDPVVMAHSVVRRSPWCDPAAEKVRPT
jgi:hypothetical protein